MLHTSPSIAAQDSALVVEEVVAMLRAATSRWHEHSDDRAETQSIAGIVLQLHRANFDLWHEEDKARDPDASDAVIAAVKRNIDRLNQQRNDTVEKLDTRLIELAGKQNESATLNSETPGLILDRLSILHLKIFHTSEQVARADVDEAHRERNRERLNVLELQAADLTRCLRELWDAVLAGTRRFKLYRQMKMYNDPTLNPIIYGSSTARSTR